MAYTQGDLDRLQSAIARGVQRLKMGDEEVQFRSLAEMERLEARLKRELGATTRSRVATIQTRTGW